MILYTFPNDFEKPRNPFEIWQSYLAPGALISQFGAMTRPVGRVIAPTGRVTAPTGRVIGPTRRIIGPTRRIIAPVGAMTRLKHFFEFIAVFMNGD